MSSGHCPVMISIFDKTPFYALGYLTGPIGIISSHGIRCEIHYFDQRIRFGTQHTFITSVLREKRHLPLCNFSYSQWVIQIVVIWLTTCMMNLNGIQMVNYIVSGFSCGFGIKRISTSLNHFDTPDELFRYRMWIVKQHCAVINMNKDNWKKTIICSRSSSFVLF